MVREFRGIWIPREIWLHPDLSLIDKALLAEIHSFGDCKAGNEYFAKFFGVSPSTISRAIMKLSHMELISTFYILNKEGRRREMKSLIYSAIAKSQNDSSAGVNLTKSQESKCFDINTKIINKDDELSDDELTQYKKNKEIVYRIFGVSIPEFSS
jgi:DNA-binding transcriptional ArsR family regulator